MNELHNKDGYRLGTFQPQRPFSAEKTRVKMMIFIEPLLVSSSVTSSDEGLGGQNVPSPYTSLFCILLIYLLLLLYSC